MEIRKLGIPDIKILTPGRFRDDRGFFSETYSKRVLSEAGIVLDFVQDNHSLSVSRGVVRGLHFQTPPFAQDKLIRVLEGAIFDVAIDLRKSSPTFGKYVSTVISADAWNQIFIPVGFAHGFCTLEPNTEVIYKVSNYYSRANERGLYWADPRLGIAWPVREAEAIVSEKDKLLPMFSALESFFE